MTCLGFCFCCASHVAPAKGGLLKVLLASLSFVLVFTLLVGPTNGQGTQGSVLQAVPEASNSSWKAGGASGLRVVVGPPSFLLKGPVALKLAVSPSTQQVEWTWVRSSFTTIPSQLQAALIGPGVVVPLANFTASDVNLTVSGGNFTTSPEGNFTFTPKNASILFGRVTGNYFGNNVDLKNVNVDIPSNQITHIAGQISATENALLLMADSDPIVRIRDVLQAVEAGSGLLGLAGNSFLQFQLHVNATGPLTTSASAPAPSLASAPSSASAPSPAPAPSPALSPSSVTASAQSYAPCPEVQPAVPPCPSSP